MQREILPEEAVKAVEEERVGRIGARAVDVDGITAREVVRALSVNGPRTVARLAKDLNIEIRIIDGYVRALKRRKAIRLRANKRGTLVVELRRAA